MRHPVLERLTIWFDRLDGQWESRSEVDKFIASEREHHPDELADLSDSLLNSWLTSEMNRQITRARHQSRKSAFASTVRRVEQAGGTPTEAAFVATGLLADAMVVAEGNVRKRVADMTGQDHLFVAGRYDHVGRRVKLLAQFHVAVAKKVGDSRTADVFTDEAYASLYRSITGEQHPRAVAA